MDGSWVPLPIRLKRYCDPELIALILYFYKKSIVYKIIDKLLITSGKKMATSNDILTPYEEMEEGEIHSPMCGENGQKTLITEIKSVRKTSTVIYSVIAIIKFTKTKGISIK